MSHKRVAELYGEICAETKNINQLTIKLRRKENYLQEICDCDNVLEAVAEGELSAARLCTICGNEEESVGGEFKELADRTVIQSFSGIGRQTYYPLRDLLTRHEYMAEHFPTLVP